MLRYLPVLVAALASGCAVSPDPTRIERDELAPTGVLRVAVYTGNPVIGSPDPRRGEPSGPTASLGKALGVHAGLPVQLIAYADESKMLADAPQDRWDVAALACEPERALEYARPHLLAGARGSAGVPICLAVPAGRREALDYVTGFVLRAKAQGLVARAIAESGLTGARVAP
jgi:polar amino acid transport system substrate-binding protein